MVPADRKAYAMMTREQARAAASRLIRKMRSIGWKADVWENLGWHYSIRRGQLAIYEHFVGGRPRYQALLSTDKYAGGEAFWTNRDSYRDPNSCEAAQVRTALQFILKCRDAMLVSMDARVVEQVRRKIGGAPRRRLTGPGAGDLPG